MYDEEWFGKPSHSHSHFLDEEEDHTFACGSTWCNPGKHDACAHCGMTSHEDEGDTLSPRSFESNPMDPNDL